MILIADSGSTKIQWAFINGNLELEHTWQAAGINPYQQDEKEIITQLQHAMPIQKEAVERVYFYGAGATAEGARKLENSLGVAFRNAYLIDIQSDILAVAYALCGKEAGIACILGTGSNSCEYNGRSVVKNVGGFGFILGDQGSGAVLGRQLICDYLHQILPKALQENLQQKIQLSPSTLLEKVYQETFPNRFLAGFAPFIYQNRHNTYIQKLIKTHFRLFFEYKVLCYDASKHYPIHFTGSIAYYFQSLLHEVAQEFDLEIKSILQNPMDGLIHYHQKKAQRIC